MPQQLMRRASALLFIGMAAAFALWKARYGLEFFDEPYFVAPGFKLHALGDAFLKTEILNGPRWHDLLNHYLIRVWLPYSILAIRISGLVVLLGSLLVLSGLSFRKHWGWFAALLICPYFVFDIMGRPGWSYNDWARLAILWHAFFLLLARSHSPARFKVALFAAGASMALAIVAYHPLLFSLGLTLLLLVIFRPSLEGLRFYFLGMFCALLPFLVFLMFHFEEWRFAMDAISKFAERRITLLKLEKLVGYSLTRVALWTLLGAGLALRMKGHWRTLAFTLLSVLLAGHFLYKLNQSHDHAIGWVLGALVSLGLFASVALFLSALRTKDFSLLFIGLFTPAAAFCMGMSSWAGNGSLYWVVPAAVLSLGVIYQEALPRAARTFAFLYVILLNGATFSLTSVDAFKDHRVGELTARLEMPPYEGIYTHPNRARMLDFFDRVTRGKAFILTLGPMPQAFLFNQARASSFSIWGSLQANEAHQVDALHFILSERRHPDLLLVDKGASWKRRPYQLFADCIRGPLIEEYGGYGAYEVKAEAIESCIALVTKNSPELLG